MSKACPGRLSVRIELDNHVIEDVTLLELSELYDALSDFFAPDGEADEVDDEKVAPPEWPDWDDFRKQNRYPWDLVKWADDPCVYTFRFDGTGGVNSGK